MADEDVKITHKLRRPIFDKDGEPVHEISFREPTGGDIVRCGNPVKYAPNTDDIAFDEVKASRMLAVLSGLPLPSIEKMNSQDWVDCAWGIARFFLPGMPRRESSQP